MTNETLEKHEKTCDICQTTNPENKIGKRLATKAIKRNSENNDNGLCLNAPNKCNPKGELYDTQGIEGLARVGEKKQTAEECNICDKEKNHHGPCVLSTAYEKHTEKQTVEDRRSKFLNALHSEDTMPPKREKQTGREWVIEQFIKWNYGDSDISFGTQELHHAIDLTEAEEREKIKNSLSQAERIINGPLGILITNAEEKGRREEREKWSAKPPNVIFEEGYDAGEEKGRREEREKCKYDFDKMFVDAAKDAEEKGRRETAKAIFEEIWAKGKVNEYNEMKIWVITLSTLEARFLPKEPKEKEAKT